MLGVDGFIGRIKEKIASLLVNRRLHEVDKFAELSNVSEIPPYKSESMDDGDRRSRDLKSGYVSFGPRRYLSINGFTALVGLNGVIFLRNFERPVGRDLDHYVKKFEAEFRANSSFARRVFEGVFNRNGDIELALPLHYKTHSYFHWITQNLIKLRHWDYYRKNHGAVPKLLLFTRREVPRDFIAETLDLFHIRKEDLIHRKKKEPVDVRRTVNPVCFSGSVVTSPGEIYWLREKVLGKIPAATEEFPDRIYISRRRASDRKVVNEVELRDILAQFGFMPVELERRTFREQVQMFRGANVVIAPHGGGLTNILWGDDLKVFEFGRGSRSYEALSKIIGMEYKALDGMVSGGSIKEELRVDCEEMKRFLGEKLK